QTNAPHRDAQGGHQQACHMQGGHQRVCHMQDAPQQACHTQASKKTAYQTNAPHRDARDDRQRACHTQDGHQQACHMRVYLHPLISHTPVYPPQACQTQAYRRWLADRDVQIFRHLLVCHTQVSQSHALRLFSPRLRSSRCQFHAHHWWACQSRLRAFYHPS
ncbi:MAG: hypothetical protein RSD76_06930, partial [Clostridia bacterium]